MVFLLLNSIYFDRTLKFLRRKCDCFVIHVIDKGGRKDFRSLSLFNVEIMQDGDKLNIE